MGWKTRQEELFLSMHFPILGIFPSYIVIIVHNP